MKKLFLTAAVALGLGAPAFSSPLVLTDLVRTGTVSSGTGGVFYDGFALIDDILDPLFFDTGDFNSTGSPFLEYDFTNPSVSSFNVDPFGPQDAFFDIVDVGFSGDTIEFRLSYSAGDSFGTVPYPGSAGAVLSLTSADFSSAPVVDLNTASSLEEFFFLNADPVSGEFQATVDFSVQAVNVIPLPASVLFLGSGLAAVALFRRRRGIRA